MQLPYTNVCTTSVGTRSASLNRPNFLYIGPDKAGSSWLYRALRYHDQVYVPAVKELFFFDRFYDRGWAWYERYFRRASPATPVVGELSHDYLFDPAACERIAEELPDVKLMVCLREPCERAFSSYLHMIKQGRVASSFEEALSGVDELVDHGAYSKHLSRYLQRFRRDRIFVAVFDDLVADPQRYFDVLCDFLEISSVQLPPELTSRALPAGKPRWPIASRILWKLGWTIRQLGIPGLVSTVKQSRIVQGMLYQTYLPGNKPRIASETHEKLRRLFAPSVGDLDVMLGLDLAERWGYSSVAEQSIPE